MNGKLVIDVSYDSGYWIVSPKFYPDGDDPYKELDNEHFAGRDRKADAVKEAQGMADRAILNGVFRKGDIREAVVYVEDDDYVYTVNQDFGVVTGKVSHGRVAQEPIWKQAGFDSEEEYDDWRTRYPTG